MRLRYACASATHGTAIAAWRCLDALRAVGAPVTWQPLADLPSGCAPVPPDDRTPPERAALAGRRAPDETLVLHAEPRGWAACRAALEPARVVGHVVWETERVPSRWIADLASVDELWVPTKWNRATFAEAFDGPVHVVPHAATLTEPAAPPVTLGPDTFVVATVSAWDWRKRPDRAIEAFLQAFGPSDDAALVVKTGRWPLAWPTGGRPPVPTVGHVTALVPPERRHQVHIATGEWAEAEVLGLLARADCSLSLTSSEGWGLGAFDAACLGTPVVITGFGGQVEWLGAGHPGLLPWEPEPATHPYAHLFDAGMEWARPQLDAAVDLLRDLAADRAPALRKATDELAATLPVRYAPERVGRTALAALAHGGDPGPGRVAP